MSEFEITPQSLPPSWVVTNLGAVVDYGKTEKAEPSEIPGDAWVLELEDIEKDSSRILDRFTQSQRQSRSTKNRFNAGDVLYGKLRPYLNKVVIADKPGFCTTEIVPLPASTALDNRYLFHWLKHPAFLKYVEAASHGMNMPRLGTEAGRSAPLVVAPRNEQTRIADQLDTLLARIQACNDRLDAIPALLKRFRKAVVSAGVAGELTADWRPAGEVSEWVPTEVQTICETGRVITYGVVKLGDETSDGTPCLRTSNVRWLRFENEGIKRIARELSAQYARTVLSGDEVLVNVRGTLGGVAVATSEMAGWNVSREIAVVPVDKARFNPHYVALCIASDESQRWLGAMEKGVAYVGINIEDLRKLPIRLPPTDEQDEIVKRVQAYLSFADRLDARCVAARRHAQRIPSLTLAKAFRGELVQQDPNDEPASVLLQRIAKTPIPAMKMPLGRYRSKQPTKPTPPPTIHPNWAALPAGVWAASAQPDEHATAAMLIAVLKTWGQPMPQDQARLAAMLCLQPRLFTAVLPANESASWRRLVGAEAEPLPASVTTLQPSVHTPWRRALAGLRARGDLVASGSGPQDTWALGPGADRVDTAGWPDGRAGWVVAYLRAHGVEAVLPSLSVSALDFVHARAA